MRTYLIPNHGSFYKANLHCHSTVSDGKWTPEQIKENYKARGYSIVAYTDHNVFVTHNELDEDFLPLNGYELDFVQQNRIEGKSPKVCHVFFISLDENKKMQSIIFESRFIERNFDKLCIDNEKPLRQRQYNTEFISAIMAEGVADGFFVTYNCLHRQS